MPKITNRITTNPAGEYATDSITSSEWGVIELVLEKLELLAIVLRLFESTEQPTIQQVYPCLIQLLNEFESSPSPLNKTLSVSLKAQLENYFNITEDYAKTFDKCSLFIVATFLDPRTKIFAFLKKRKLISYMLGQVKELITKQLKNADPSTPVVKKTFLASIYQQSVTNENELEQYLLMPAVQDSKSFSLLTWWKSHEPDFPMLSGLRKRCW